MRVRTRSSDALELGGIALVDILANSVAAILVLIALRLAITTQELGLSTAQRKTEHASIVLARRLSSIAVSSDLPSSGNATLHDYPDCNAKRAAAPEQMPTIELHSTHVLIRNTGDKLDRTELLADSNRLDLYLQTLPGSLQKKVRCDIFDIRLYYIALSIFVENGLPLPLHYHFVGENLLAPPMPAESGKRRRDSAAELGELLAEINKKRYPLARGLAVLPGVSPPQVPWNGLTRRPKPKAEVSSAAHVTGPSLPPPDGQRSPGSAVARATPPEAPGATAPGKPVESPPKVIVAPPMANALRSPQGAASALAGPPPDAGATASGDRTATAHAGAGGNTDASGAADGGVDAGGTRPTELQLADSKGPSRPAPKAESKVGPGVLSDAEFPKRRASSSAQPRSGRLNLGNYGDAILLSIDEHPETSGGDWDSHGGFSIRTFQTGLIASLPADILRQLDIEPQKLRRADDSQLGADSVDDFLVQLMMSVSLAEKAHARAVSASTTARPAQPAPPLLVPLRRPHQPAEPQLGLSHKPLVMAVVEAQTQHKPLVAYVGTSWCGPCQSFQSSVLPHPAVQRALSRVSFVHYDAEVEPGLSAAKSLKVESYPTFVALGRAGAEIARLQGLPTVERFQQWLERLTVDGQGSAPAHRISSPDKGSSGPKLPQAEGRPAQGAAGPPLHLVREVTPAQIAEARRFVDLFRDIFGKVRKDTGSPQPLQLQHIKVGEGQTTLSLKVGELITDARLRAGTSDPVGAEPKDSGQVSLKLRPQPFPADGFRVLFAAGTLILPGSEDKEPGLRWRRVVVQNLAQRLIVEGYVLADLRDGQLELAAETNDVVIDGVPSIQLPKPHPRLLLILLGYGLVLGLLLLCTLKSRRQLL